jgi:hypothetical protein
MFAFLMLLDLFIRNITKTLEYRKCESKRMDLENWTGKEIIQS